MRKILLFCLCLYVFKGIQAQSAYIPFPSEMIIYGSTKTENYPVWYYPHYAVHRVEITGDTIISGFHYSKLYSGFSSNMVAYVRNDTTNKKVFIYHVATGTEDLLYDFNLMVGDTVNTGNGYGFYMPLVGSAVPNDGSPIFKKSWVTSIDSIFMPHDGLYHRRFNFAGTVPNPMSSDSADVQVNSSSTGPFYVAPGSDLYMTMNPLIEGVGQIKNPISHYSFFEGQWDYSLFCASINGISLVNYAGPPAGYYGGPNGMYIDPVYCNSLATAINEINEAKDIVVFPNPTTGLLQITTKQQLNSIEVTDVLGNSIYHYQINNNIGEIDISGASPGIYFIRLSDAKGDFIVKKIVKQ